METENITAQEQIQEQASNDVSVFSLESIDTILNTLNGNLTGTVDSTQVLIDGLEERIASAQIIAQNTENIETTATADDSATSVSEQYQTDLERLAMSDESNEAEISTEELVEEFENGFNVANEEQRDNEIRFSGAPWFERTKTFRIIIAGLGGIGSYVSFLVSRLHPQRVKLFDPDRIEESNLAGQFFCYDDIGNYKVTVANRVCHDYSGYYCFDSYPDPYTGQATEDIMICGFDNMEARKIFYRSWKAHVYKKEASERKNCILIDGRLGLEEMQIFSIRGDEKENMGRYEKEYLFDDSEAEQVPCSMKQTSFMASMIGSVMTNILVNHAVNIDSPMDVRPIPFLTMYNADDMRMQLKF